MTTDTLPKCPHGLRVPRNGHTAGNMIGLAKNEVTLIQRNRAR